MVALHLAARDIVRVRTRAIPETDPTLRNGAEVALGTRDREVEQGQGRPVIQTIILMITLTTGARTEAGQDQRGRTGPIGREELLLTVESRATQGRVTISPTFRPYRRTNRTKSPTQTWSDYPSKPMNPNAWYYRRVNTQRSPMESDLGRAFSFKTSSRVPWPIKRDSKRETWSLRSTIRDVITKLCRKRFNLYLRVRETNSSWWSRNKTAEQ